jgi:hypothetical protein
VAIIKTTTQVSGIYVDVTRSTVTVFDHLEANVIKKIKLLANEEKVITFSRKKKIN